MSTAALLTSGTEKPMESLEPSHKEVVPAIAESQQTKRVRAPLDKANNAPRCTARSKRSGQRCRAPAVSGWRVCRMHGARGGTPEGERGLHRRSFDNTISLPKSWSAGLVYNDVSMIKLIFAGPKKSLFITAAEVDAARARDQGEWCRTHIRRRRSAPRSFAGHSMRRCKPEASSGISWSLAQIALRVLLIHGLCRRVIAEGL